MQPKPLFLKELLQNHLSRLLKECAIAMCNSKNKSVEKLWVFFFFLFFFPIILVENHPGVKELSDCIILCTYINMKEGLCIFLSWSSRAQIDHYFPLTLMIHSFLTDERLSKYKRLPVKVKSKVHRYPIFSTRYPVMCKVYTEYHDTSEIKHGLCACTADNPSLKLGDYLSVKAHKPCSISQWLLFQKDGHFKPQTPGAGTL